MSISTLTRQRVGGAAAALVLGVAGAIGFAAGTAYAATATITKESQWATGYVAAVTIHNDQSSTITSWRVEFTLPAGTTVDYHWNANLTRSGSRYVFTNVHWNGTVAPGAATGFGFIAGGTGDPVNCTVNWAACDGGPDILDVRPPSTPANVRATGAGNQLVLSWDPSTDDRGVTGYEVYFNETLVITTEQTSHTMPVPPPMIYTVGVRAFDAAGNLSPFGIVYLGQPTDLQPPTAPPNVRIATIAGNNLEMRWDPATDDVFVAGYEVYLNGTFINAVGGTRGYVPFQNFGTYVIDVRAFDHAGKFSPFTRYAIAIDPPPPPGVTP